MPNARNVKYRGPVTAVSSLAQMLREAGVEVSYQPPNEHRSTSEAIHEVVVYLLCRGSESAIADAVNRFRASRLGLHAKIETEAPHEDIDGDDE
jgi:hypothetical protein